MNVKQFIRVLVAVTVVLLTATYAVAQGHGHGNGNGGGNGGGGGGGGGYTFVTLDDRPGANTTRSGVNDVQETNGSFFCVGYLDGIADLQAVVWEVIPGGSSYTVTTHYLAEGQLAYATAINTNGEIVGGSDASLDGGLYWPDRNSSPLALPPLDGENATRASGINADGIIVGESVDSSNEGTPVAWRAVVVNNAVQIDGPFALGDSGWGEANDINQCDANGFAQVVGWSYPEGPVLWEVDCLSPTLSSTGPVLLVPPNQTTSSPAEAINDAGDVCGRKDGVAFRYLADGEIQYLSTPNRSYSRGRGINASRQVVGRVDVYKGNIGVDLYGTLWQANGSRVYLNSFLNRTSEWKQIEECTSITDSGAIGGRGRLKASFPDNNLQSLLMIPK